MRGPRGNGDISLSQPDKGNTARADGLHARCAGRMALHIKDRACGQASRCFPRALALPASATAPSTRIALAASAPAAVPARGSKRAASAATCTSASLPRAIANRPVPWAARGGGAASAVPPPEQDQTCSSALRPVAPPRSPAMTRRPPAAAPLSCRPRLTDADKRQHPWHCPDRGAVAAASVRPTDRGKVVAAAGTPAFAEQGGATLAAAATAAVARAPAFPVTSTTDC